jgi:predicted trehalose synthase
MSNSRCLSLLPVFLSLLISSCGDDPKLVEKREKQKVEITRLKGELAIIEEKLKDLPADVSNQLAEAKSLSEKQAAEIAELESQAAALENQKRSLQAEHDAYRAKYQVK